MEEKNVTKISLSTFLFILSIIVIIVMACFIVKLNNDKSLANNKVTELNKKVSGLESTVNNLQDTINDISNTIEKSNISTETKNESNVEISTNSNIETNINTNDEISANSKIETSINNNDETNTNRNNHTNESEKKNFSDDEIKNAIQNYLDLVGALEGSPEGLLVKLGLTNYGANTKKADNNYIKTNIKYSDYKAKMLNYMTEQWFENNFTKSFKNVNGYLYYFDGGATGLEYEVNSVTIKGDYSDLNYIANVDNINLDDSREQLNIEFHIENYNDKCVISYCD